MGFYGIFNTTFGQVVTLATEAPYDTIDAVTVLSGTGQFLSIGLAGTFKDSLPVFGGNLISRGGTDIFVARISASGTDRAGFGGNGADRPTAIAGNGQHNLGRGPFDEFNHLRRRNSNSGCRSGCSCRSTCRTTRRRSRIRPCHLELGGTSNWNKSTSSLVVDKRSGFAASGRRFFRIKLWFRQHSGNKYGYTERLAREPPSE